jgi:hypothetical protein
MTLVSTSTSNGRTRTIPLSDAVIKEDVYRFLDNSQGRSGGVEYKFSYRIED